MRRFLAFALAVGLPSLGLPQGTVNFANNVPFQTPDPTGGMRLVYLCGPFDPSGPTALKGTNYAAELYYGPAGSLQPLPSRIRRFRPLTTLQPGTWNPSPDPFVTLPGINIGDTTTLQVKVWDLNIFPAYELALAGGGMALQSAPFWYTVPPPGSDPSAYFMEGLEAFAAITCPEPAAMALSFLSIAILLLARTRHRPCA